MLGLFCLFFIGVIFQLTWPENALAWGPGVHTMIGLSSLNEVSLLLPSIARMITSFPLEYLYGSLAADFFIGKSRRKKRGNPHNWEGGFRFLREASDDREASYALQDLLFSGKAVRLGMFQKNLALMVDLSCRVAKDFLTHPESSPCLLYNPVGRRGTCLSTRKRFSVSMPYAHPLTRRFTVDPEHLRP